jgi:hypothetical protein
VILWRYCGKVGGAFHGFLCGGQFAQPRIWYLQVLATGFYSWSVILTACFSADLWNAFHRTSYLVCPAFAIPLVGILEE